MRQFHKKDIGNITEPKTFLFKHSVIPDDIWGCEDDYAMAEKLYPLVVGYFRNGDTEPRYGVVCMNSKFDHGIIYLNRKQFKALKRYADHMESRMKDGVSYRDSWNVDIWLADTCAKILKLLKDNTHGFPPNMEYLHRKALEIEGKELILTEEEKKMSADDLHVKWYHEDLSRMIFLFQQWDEETCVEKNQYKWDLEIVKEKLPNGCFKVDFVGTPEQTEEANKHENRKKEIYEYRSKCFHTAMKIMEIYIEHLWD